MPDVGLQQQQQRQEELPASSSPAPWPPPLPDKREDEHDVSRPHQPQQRRQEEPPASTSPAPSPRPFPDEGKDEPGVSGFCFFNSFVGWGSEPGPRHLTRPCGTRVREKDHVIGYKLE